MNALATMTSSAFVKAGPLFDFSIDEAGAVVRSAVVVAAASGGILEESMGGGR